MLGVIKNFKYICIKKHFVIDSYLDVFEEEILPLSLLIAGVVCKCCVLVTVEMRSTRRAHDSEFFLGSEQGIFRVGIIIPARWGNIPDGRLAATKGSEIAQIFVSSFVRNRLIIMRTDVFSTKQYSLVLKKLF